MTTLAMSFANAIPSEEERPAALPADADDATLLRAFRKGRAGAMDLLVSRHGNALMGYLTATAGADAARDLWQEAWLRVMKKSGQFTGGSFRAWLFTIARNLGVDRFRRAPPETSLDAPLDDDGLTLADCIPSSMRAPAAEYELVELRLRAAACVRKLPPDQREIFLLRVQGEMTFAEIAKQLRVPLNTALGRMHYAVTKLRIMMEEKT